MKTSLKHGATGKNLKNSAVPTSIPFESLLSKRLQDLDFAAGYLTACYEEGTEVFLLGIRDVAEAHGGLRKLAKKTELSRENLYDMLSKDGNPRFSSLTAVLDELGIELQCAVKRKKGRKRR